MTDIPTFSLSDFAAAETADMVVVIDGRASDWVWTFAGPGHAQTIALSSKLAKEALDQQQAVEQALVNGRKVKVPTPTTEEVRAKNIDNVVARIVGWTPVRIDGKDYPFTQDNARALLSNPAMPFAMQAMEFLAADDAFRPKKAA